jgi:hypothetical protein
MSREPRRRESPARPIRYAALWGGGSSLGAPLGGRPPASPFFEVR